MTIDITFDRAATLAWLRESATGTDYPRAEAYGELTTQCGAQVETADESKLETIVGDFQDEGPGFGALRVGMWADDLILTEEPGLHATVDVPIPNGKGSTCRLAGPWAGQRQWVDLDPTTDLAETLTDYLGKVASEAQAALVTAREAVAAGVFDRPAA